MIDICCDGSGVKYHSLSYWSIVMTVPVEFSTGEFRAKQVWKVLKNSTTNQEKKIKGLLESLGVEKLELSFNYRLTLPYLKSFIQ